MATLSGGNLTNLRTTKNTVVPYLSVLKPATLLTALVNNGSIARGARTIAYDTGSGSGFATIANGQTLEVDTTDGVTKRVRVKSITGNQTSGSIEVDENGINWTDNAVIRIKHTYDIQPIPPVIRSQVFYKFYDIPYTDQNEEPTPVAIAGPHRAGFLSGGSIVFTLDATPSYAIADGATITGYTWGCLHNGGGTSGITIADSADPTTTLTITQAGQYWLSLEVEDDNGKTQTTYRAIFVYDSSNPPYKDFTIQSLVGDWNTGGWRASIVATGDVSLSDFPDRALCLLWYTGYFGNSESYVDLWGVNANNNILGGYIRQDSDSDNWEKGAGNSTTARSDITFEITTPESVMDNISELGSVSLNAVPNPGKWYEYASWMTTGRAIHHLIKYQAYGILQVWDVYGLTDDSRGVLNTDFTEETLLQQINSLAFNRGIYAKMCCNRHGQLYLVKDSQILNTAGRAALDTVCTLSEADVSGIVTVVRQPEEQIAFAELNGFSFDGADSSPFISILPGYRESGVSYIMPELRGGGTTSIGSQILSSQTDSNQRIGRVVAQMNNNPRELRFATPYSGIGAFDIIPSLGWYVWGMSDNDLKRNTTLNNRKLICRNVAHILNHEGGVTRTELVFEPEAFGPDGVQGNYPLGYPTPRIPEPDWTPPAEVFNVVFTYRDNVSGHGKAFVAVVGSVTLGTIATFNAAPTTYTSVCALSETQALVCYSDGGNSNRGTACVLDISGTTITPGSEAVFETGGTTHIDVCMLSATQAIVCYRDTGNSNQGTACILDISGSTVTPGTPVVFETGATSFCSVVRLTATKAIVSYSDGGNSGSGTSCVLDVSGSTITPATPAVWHGANTGPICADVLSSTSIVIGFNIAASGNLAAITLSNITTTFTDNGANTLDSSNKSFDNTQPANHWLWATSATECVCVYQSQAASPDPFAIIAHAFTIDGSLLPQPGTPLAVSSLDDSYDECAAIGIASATKAIIFYGDSVDEGHALSIDYAAGAVTNNADEVAAGVYPQYTSAAILS